jgi:hypothetical protein
MGEFNQNVPEGGVLKVLATGLRIVRRRKHEWNPGLLKLDPKKLALRTGKEWGTKFLSFWTLDVLVNRIEVEVARARWTKDSQIPNPLDVVDASEIGLANGKRAHTMRIVCDGRHIHAYPIEDSNE